MQVNKTAGVIMGALMMIAAVVLLAIFHEMVFPCAVLGFLGYIAMADGMSDDEKKTKS